VSGKRIRHNLVLIHNTVVKFSFPGGCPLRRFDWIALFHVLIYPDLFYAPETAPSWSAVFWSGRQASLIFKILFTACRYFLFGVAFSHLTIQRFCFIRFLKIPFILYRDCLTVWWIQAILFRSGSDFSFWCCSGYGSYRLKFLKLSYVTGISLVSELGSYFRTVWCHICKEFKIVWMYRLAEV
jgi:hypothetical protein